MSAAVAVGTVACALIYLVLLRRALFLTYLVLPRRYLDLEGNPDLTCSPQFHDAMGNKLLVNSDSCPLFPPLFPQPANSFTRCNPSADPAVETTATFDVNGALTNPLECCMWTYGEEGNPSALVRTGTCSSATTETISLSGMFINSITNPDVFANVGTVK
jgi:hypothetical protein